MIRRHSAYLTALIISFSAIAVVPNSARAQSARSIVERMASPGISRAEYDSLREDLRRYGNGMGALMPPPFHEVPDANAAALAAEQVRALPFELREGLKLGIAGKVLLIGRDCFFISTSAIKYPNKANVWTLTYEVPEPLQVIVFDGSAPVIEGEEVSFLATYEGSYSHTTARGLERTRSVFKIIETVGDLRRWPSPDR